MTQDAHVLNRLADYSDAALLDELRRVASVLGQTSLTIGDVNAQARCSYAVLKKRFGGLRQALKAAGLEAPGFHRNVPDADLLDELERIWDLVLSHEGRRPFKDDLVRYSAKFSQGTYYRR